MSYLVLLGDMLLPVTPQKIQTKVKNQNKTINLINDEEINIIKGPGLRDYSFEALLPNVVYPFAKYLKEFKTAIYFLNKLRELKTSSEPFILTILRISPKGEYLFNTNTYVSLEDYSVDEDASNGLDVSVSINLKEYRYYKAKTVNFGQDGDTTTASVTNNRSDNSAPEVSSYTVKAGDTLWNIAKQALGDGSKYTTLAKINSISNPNYITIGQVIKLES